ncbi:cache domain-containing sensor histidine kinase [Paenibacillus daejeonensis]|uniref:cache domain-containing sensor histidine kinase n=1 Tax=Paenibacillus daejeonensis TaxID=135193 RepID=UPI00036AA931|nr:sensor histidine kinase [Paenibacillus daejeonensis]
MRRKFFIKNLALFLIPLLIPTIVLGTLSIIVTKRYNEAEINRNQMQLFHQMDRNIELIFNEMDALGLNFGHVETLYRLEDILRTQQVTLENKRLVQATQNFIDAPANARPYIESIYVYVRNPYNQFLASGTGLTNLREFHDLSWWGSFLDHQEAGAGIWTEERLVQRYSFEQPISVTTLFKPLYSSVLREPFGVIVLNIYTEYMERLLRTYETYPGQLLLVLDEDDRILFQSRELGELKVDTVQQAAKTNASFTLRDSDLSYAGAQLASSRYEGWRYLSLVPDQAIHPVAFRLSEFTVYVVLLSFLLGLALTYYLTGRSLRHIRRMMMIIKSAEKGLPLPQQPDARSSSDDETNYIIQTMTRNFIEHHYLSVQLSEKKYRLQAAELLALQSQMNPHFLFNTLETINWKVMGLTRRPNEANHMLENLADLMRYSLDTPGRIVTLEQEVAITHSYIALQKMRYQDKFDVIWDYDEEEAKVYSIVKLVLQPLIENSLYHGIKEKEGNGRIKIRIETADGWTRVAVIDNGVGMTPERLQEVQARLLLDGEAEDHIGLANTNRRLMLTYEQPHGLHLWSRPDWGTVVWFRIPQ